MCLPFGLVVCLAYEFRFFTRKCLILSLYDHDGVDFLYNDKIVTWQMGRVARGLGFISHILCPHFHDFKI
jgi:hypothetical protein